MPMDEDNHDHNPIVRLVHEMRSIIGDVAITLAKRIDGIDIEDNRICYTKNPGAVFQAALDEYARFIGPVAYTIGRKALDRHARQQSGTGRMISTSSISKERKVSKGRKVHS